MNNKLNYVIGLILLGIAGFCIFSKISTNKSNEDIKIENSAAVIESTRPTGMLYLYTAITEDYANSSFWGSGFGSSVFGKGNGILKKKHDCVQVLKQQVNFTINLDDVKYDLIESSDTVIVTLPPVEFSQSTIGSWFKSDSENEESATQYDATPLIHNVERKIELKYNTSDNRAKAQEQAKKCISDFLFKMGKTALFNQNF